MLFRATLLYDQVLYDQVLYDQVLCDCYQARRVSPGVTERHRY